MAQLSFKPSARTISRFLGYGLFGLVCVIVLLVLTFPYASLESRLEHEMSLRTGLPADIENLGYGFPLGLSFDAMSLPLKIPEGKTRTLHLESGRLALNPFLPFINTVKATLESNVLNGRLELQVTTRALPPRDFVSVATNLESVALSQLDWLWSRHPGLTSFQGHISGQAALTVAGSTLTECEGSGQLELDQAAADVSISGLSPVSLESLAGKANWKLEQGTLHVNRCDLQGQGVQGDIHGRIALDPQLGRSRLDLKGRLSVSQAQPQLYAMARQTWKAREKGFTLMGTTHSPMFRFE